MSINTLFWVLLVPAIAIIGILCWLTESTPQRIQRLRSYGWSQQRIATHLNLSRYRIRQTLLLNL
mgnify:CR=1 FL=1